MAYYYAKTTETVETALSSWFKGIVVNRYTSAGTISNVIDVPLTVAPVEKTHQFRKEQEMGDGRTNYVMTLPRIALAFNGYALAPDRISSLNTERFWQHALNLTDEAFVDFQPIPYDFYFTLSVRTEMMSDFTQIMEQILPYYAPTRTLRVREFSFLNIERDLPVRMTAVNAELPTDFDQSTMREVNGNCTLTVEGYMYKPVSAGKLIKNIDVKYFISPDVANEISTLAIRGFETTASIPTSGYGTSGTLDNGKGYYTLTETEN